MEYQIESDKKQESVKESLNPVFIGGTQRSGTSLLRALIDSNTKIYFPKAEMKFFVRFYHKLKLFEPLDKIENLKRFLYEYGTYRKNIQRAGLINREETLELLKENHKSWAAVYETIMTQLAAMENKVRWGEKSPGNEYFTDEILSFFPGAKILCMIRDPRAVIASSKKRYGRGMIKPLIRWKLSICRIIYDYQRLASNTFRPIFYEDLILSPEETMKGVFEFLEVTALNPINELEIAGEKWDGGGQSSYSEETLEGKGMLWKHPLTAFKRVLSKRELLVIDIFTRGERKRLGYNGESSNEESLYNMFCHRLQSNHLAISCPSAVIRALNRLTDRPLLV